MELSEIENLITEFIDFTEDWYKDRDMLHPNLSTLKERILDDFLEYKGE